MIQNVLSNFYKISCNYLNLSIYWREWLTGLTTRVRIATAQNYFCDCPNEICPTVRLPVWKWMTAHSLTRWLFPIMTSLLIGKLFFISRAFLLKYVEMSLFEEFAICFNFTQHFYGLGQTLNEIWNFCSDIL